MRRIQIIALILMVLAVTVAADWPEWRGPQRNGVVETSPPLVTTWPADGPKKVWVSEEKIPSGDYPTQGGLGSVVVADGRVYLMASLSRTEPLATRTLPAQKLTELGWTPKKPPADILAAAEQARVSPERLALKTPAEIQAWALKWIDAKLTAEQRKACGSYIVGRLKQGKDAISLAVLDRLETIKDKPFASQEAMDAWLTEHGIEGELRKNIRSRFVDKETYRDTGIYCLDAATGKTVWNEVFPGGPLLPLYGNHPASSTPCIVNGKLYVLGVDGLAFCLDAKTGEKIWSVMAGNGREQKHCSFAVVDGVAVAPTGPLVGFDAEKGTVLWSHEKVKPSVASPVPWRQGGKTHLIVRADGTLFCVEPKTGTIVWSVDEEKYPAYEKIYLGSTPVIEGDRMVVGGRSGVCIYKLSAEKADRLWDVKCAKNLSCSPIISDGHAFTLGPEGTVCINLESGKIAWQDARLRVAAYSAPVLADGRLFIQGADNKGSFGDGTLFMLPASAEKAGALSVGRIRQALCTTPAIVDGRAYCRMGNCVACYDLRR